MILRPTGYSTQLNIYEKSAHFSIPGQAYHPIIPLDRILELPHAKDSDSNSFTTNMLRNGSMKMYL